MSRCWGSAETLLQVTCEWPYVSCNENGFVRLKMDCFARYQQSDWPKGSKSYIIIALYIHDIRSLTWPVIGLRQIPHVATYGQLVNYLVWPDEAALTHNWGEHATIIPLMRFSSNVTAPKHTLVSVKRCVFLIIQNIYSLFS